MKDNLILKNAKKKIEKFNRIGLHYDLVAKAVYEKRQLCADPFSQSFTRYVIAGLISFDIGRMMGTAERAYDFKGKGFGSRLKSKLEQIKEMLEPLMNLSLTEIHLQQHRHRIVNAYVILSDNGEDALSGNSKKHFYVGASKILHFLNPALFIIVDRNAAVAFRKCHGIEFKKSTQPGYSAQKYVKCMECAQEDIQKYNRAHRQGFETLEQGTPIARIYDKLTFITGRKPG